MEGFSAMNECESLSERENLVMSGGGRERNRRASQLYI